MSNPHLPPYRLPSIQSASFSTRVVSQRAPLLSRESTDSCSTRFKNVLFQVGQDFCSYAKKSAHFISRIFILVGYEVSYNFVRDETWADLTKRAAGEDLQKTEDSNKQLFVSQWIYPTFAMLAGFTVVVLYIRCKQSARVKVVAFEQGKTVAAASAAIFAWNALYDGAVKYFLDRGYPLATAKLLACLFPGLGEGLVQFLVPNLIDWGVNLGQTRCRAISNVTLITTAKFFAKIFWNVTMGSVAGNVWALTYVCSENYDFTPVETGFFVATSVAICNKSFALITMKFNDCLEQKFLTTPYDHVDYEI